MLSRCVAGTVVLLLAVSESVFAQAPEAPAAQGKKYALIVCGHPGDKPHATLYTTVLRTMRTALVAKLGYAEDQVRLQFGGTWPADPAKPDEKPLQHGPATREAIATEAAEIRKLLQPDDSLWVIVLGHAHYDGRKSWLNLPGPDMAHDEFARLFAGLSCREQVFFITTPVSGFYVKPLAAPGRVVVSATEPDFETNETLYPQSLAEELGKLGPLYPDEDKDGIVSLFDLYVGTARNAAQRYLDGMLLATEHAQLEDNGDGRATEVQIDFLTVEQGGRNDGKPLPPRPAKADGVRSAQIQFAKAEKKPDSPAETKTDDKKPEDKTPDEPEEKKSAQKTPEEM